MNKQALNGLASAMLSLGAWQAPAQAYGTYVQRAYSRPLHASIDRSHRPPLELSSQFKENTSQQDHLPSPNAPSLQLVQSLSPSTDIILKQPNHRTSTAAALTIKQDDLSIKKLNPIRELVIIDEAVADKHVIYQQLKPGVDIQEIQSNHDGLNQLKTILSRYQNLDALHLFSHGQDGVIYLGNSAITQQLLQEEVNSLSALDKAMKDGADLLLYGCNLAQTKRGEQLLALISNVGNVDVAASNDATGNSQLEGDWDLEIHRGNIETAPRFDSITMADFSSVLAITDGSGGTIDFGSFPGGATNYYATNTYNNVGGSGFNLQLSANTSGGQEFGGAQYGSVYVNSYFNAGLTSVTIDFTGGETFDANSIYIYNGQGSTKTFRITSDQGDSQDSASLSNSGSATVNLSGFTGVTRLTISNNDGSDLGWFRLDDLNIGNAAAPPDSDGSLTAAGGVSEPVAINTTVDSVGEAVDVFDFTLSDAGTADGLAMTVSQVVLNVSGTASDTQRGNITWRLDGSDASNVTGVYNGGSDTITFSGLSISIADGGSEVYTVNAYYNDNTSLTEGLTYILSVDGDTDLTVGGSGTQMGATSAVSNSTGSTANVTATALAFTTQPASSTSGSALGTQPVVTAQDAFGNTDTDFTETITLTEASAGSLTNASVAASSGVATFSSLTYSATADQQSFTLTANDQDGVGSDLSTVDANAVTSDVVATQLVFDTQPVPLSVNTGVATNLTTVPVVSARDGNNIVDTGYGTGITLAEVNGAGSATMSATGDTDGSGATATITPSSGVSTFTSMQLTYTASGGSSETFNLQASSGGLSTANSSQMTGLVADSDGFLTAAGGVSEPVAINTTVDTVGEAVDVFDFTLSDAGTADGLAMTVSQVVLNVSGTASDTQRGNITWRLDGSDASNVTGVYNGGSDTITFSGLSISIADGGSEVYTVNAYYNDNTSLTEGLTYILSVDGDTDLTVGGSGTQMGVTSAVTNSTGSTANVTATALAFTTQPASSTSGSALGTQPVVTAQDAFGNTDTDFTEIITLTEASAGSLINASVAASSGVATFSSLTYSATADQQSFTLTANDQDGVGSDLSTVGANAVTSDVVATQLVFDTQPVPLSVNTGVATNLTTVPVVSARDGNNIVDTGYGTGITLVEVNGAGSATMSATGDTDGSGATATITPSSGVSTFTSMQLTYTASGGSSETFNLQASSGGLSTANSSQMTGLIADSDGTLTTAGGVSEPVALNLSVDTVGEAVDLFDFTVSDGGSADGLAMLVSAITVNVSGTASDSERDKITWSLNGNDASNVTGTYNSGSDTLTFTGLSISVADGASEVYTINGYYNDNSGLTAGNTIILSVDGDTDLTLGGSGTQMGATSAVSNSTGTVITDDVAPVVTSVSVPANSTYGTGDNLDFTVNVDENVTVNTSGGTPRLSLTLGSSGAFANYVSGSGTSALLFRYTVQAGDEDSDGIALASTLDANAGTLRDGSGNDLNTSLNSIASLTSVLVDAQAPTVAEVTGVTSPDNDTTPNVTFSTSKAGTLAVGGSCGSASEGAVSSGNNTIALTQTDNSTALAGGTYSDCTVTVTDSVGNVSNVLTLSSFVIDTAAPAVDTNTGTTAAEGSSGSLIGNSALSASDNLSTAGSVTYTLVSVPANGTLRRSGSALSTSSTFTQDDIDNSLISYDHDGSETTSDSFSFSLSDALSNSNNNGGANFSFAMTISAVNDAPVATADSASTNEDNPVAIDVLDNDSDADDTLNAASVTVASGPSNGGTSVNTGTGVITYTPTADFNGSDSFTYTVEDASGDASSAATVTITVNAQNDAPVAVDDTDSTDVNTLVSIDVAANDTDVDSGDGVDASTLAVVSAASNGSAVFNSGTNQIDYTPSSGYTGTDTFTYTIEDGSGATSNAATVTVSISDPNTAPTAANDSATTNEDTAVAINVLSNDSDSDGSLVVSTVSVSTSPANGAAVVNTSTGVITYTPSANFNGSDSFTYTVEDNAGSSSAAATVSVTVNAVNDAPSAVDDTVSLQEDSSLSINVLGNDSDVDGSLVATSLTVVSEPASGSAVVDSGTNNIVYTPTGNFNGSDSFTYQVEDNQSLASNIATVTITVNAVNDLPVASDDSADVVPGASVSINVVTNDSDSDGSLDNTAIAITVQPTEGSLTDNNDGTLSYTPNSSPDVASGDSFRYTVADNEGGVSNAATVSIRFIPQAAPEISGTPDSRVEENSTYSFTPTVTVGDANFDLVFSVSNLPAWASFNSSTGALTGTPDADDVGVSEGVQISVSDGVNSDALTPFDIAVIAMVDTDGDGIRDFQELEDGTSPTDPLDYLDTSPPVLQDPADIIVDAESLFTEVNIAQLLGLAQDAETAQVNAAVLALASDNVDGQDCCSPEPLNASDGVFRLAPGAHDIVWQATDQRGNVSEMTQRLNIRPLVSLSKDAVSVEGASVSIRFILNGPAPFYPLDIPYVLDDSSTLGSADHDLSNGMVTFTTGQTEVELTVNITADTETEGEEVLVLRLDDRTTEEEDLQDGFAADAYDINSGARSTYRLTIVEDNVAPSVDITVEQATLNSPLITAADGTVMVVAAVQDPNIGDSHEYDWSASDSLLVDTDGDIADNTLTFDPSSLSPGSYQVSLRVTDSQGGEDTETLNLILAAALPILDAGSDSDGDGIDDLAEGTADTDKDGILDYLDNISASNVLPEDVDTTDAFLLECEPGVLCRLGQFSITSSSGGARLDEEEIAAQEALTEDSEFEFVGDLFDFEIAELPTAGQTTRIVIPLREAIPANGVYRKLMDGQWQTFVENASNALHSSPGSLGFCPPPGDALWESGLVAGYLCLQLTIEDGGPNDADGLVNSAVADPGGISVLNSQGVKTKGGGGSMGWWMLSLLSLLLICRLKKHKGNLYLGQLKMVSLPLVLGSLALVNSEPSRALDWQAIAKDSFVEVGLLSVDSSQSKSGFINDMNRAGADITVSEYDTRRQAYHLSLAYQYNPRFAFMLGYADLGEVEVDLNGQGTSESVLQGALKRSYPLTGNGWSLAVRANQSIMENTRAFFKFGLFVWDGDVDASGADVDTGLSSGVDPFATLGVDYKLHKNVSLGVQYQYHILDDQRVDGFGLLLGLYY